MSAAKVIFAGFIFTAKQKQSAIGIAVRGTSVFLVFTDVMIIKTGARHHAKHQSHSAFVRPISLGTVYQVNIV